MISRPLVNRMTLVKVVVTRSTTTDCLNDSKTKLQASRTPSIHEMLTFPYSKNMDYGSWQIETTSRKSRRKCDGN